MFLFVSISIIALSVGVGCIISKSKFDNGINSFCSNMDYERVDSQPLRAEMDRIEELQFNLKELRKNIGILDIPLPEEVKSYDNVNSSLNKISRFFEEHTSLSVGTEQMLLSFLPSSQLGEALHSLAQSLPSDIGRAVFGDALSALKDGIQSIPTTEFLHRFVEGASHLSNMSIISMQNAIGHHDFLGACLTPIKSGAMEALGVNDFTHNLVNSLHNVGEELMNTASASMDVGGLTDISDIDITGHIPVVTIAISSFREYQLLTDDKTDYVTSLKNIALDAAGAGVGGVAGAKAGALIGSIFGPVGTVVGGILGGVSGAIGGRAITNNIKVKPLKDATDEYEKQYSQMKNETDINSRETVGKIRSFAYSKREEFHNSLLVKEDPVSDSAQTVSQIALVLYQSVANELIKMKTSISDLRKSIWYSGKKYDAIISSIEAEIQELEKQLPPVESITNSPELLIDKLLDLKMPNRSAAKAYQDKIDECCEELKTINDKNNSAVLIWSYMVNNLYQKTLNDIADFSNSQMNTLNQLFGKWKNTLLEIEKKINVEKGKLGLK